MKTFRKILWPFSVLYHAITSLRNLAYDNGWLRSTRFNIPVIAVGNLSTGGTGKSPMIEYLIRLLSNKTSICVLSRGYGRRSKGFVWGSADSSADDLGDEPMQFQKKFSNISVAVDGNRVQGINRILKDKPAVECILLDDAFQHRKVRAGLYILLSSYDELYTEDMLLPAGNLRESRTGAGRADIIVVTKCPSNMSEEDKKRIRSKLKLKESQSLFFSHIQYDSYIQNQVGKMSLEDLKDFEFLLVTGIAKPKYLKDHLTSLGLGITHLEFADHHRLTPSDHDRIYRTFENFPEKKRILLTTEKDYVRSFSDDENAFFIGIESVVDSQNDFNTIIEQYVREY